MSPEMYQKMKLLQEKPIEMIKQEDVDIDYLKSDIYSLGLTVLQAVNLLNNYELVGINCDEEHRILESQLNSILNEKLKYIVEGMLKFSPDSRITLDEMEK